MIVAGVALSASGLLSILVAVGIQMADVWRGRQGRSVLGVLIIGNVVIGTGDILDGSWPWSILSYATAVVLAWLWWRNRKRRKRVLDALGAKSRALRDALVRRTREAAQPRPVLRPVPGGVR